MLSSLNSFTLSVRLMQTNSNQALVWIFSRVSQKMEIPLFKVIHIENIIPMTLCFPGIVFLDIQKSPKKILVYIDFIEIFYACLIKKGCSLLITLGHV